VPAELNVGVKSEIFDLCLGIQQRPYVHPTLRFLNNKSNHQKATIMPCFKRADKKFSTVFVELYKSQSM